MKKLYGEHAAGAYVPKEDQPAVIYTHRFKPEHYREGAKLVTERFPEAQLELGQRRHNVFLKRPATYEIVNLTFFDDESALAEWHESKTRMRIVDKIRPMLDGPVDVQTYQVAGVVGIEE